MYIKNSYVVFIYRLLFLVLCGFNLLVHISFTDMASNNRMFAYFTVESQIFSFVVLFLCTKNAAKEIRHHNVCAYRYEYPRLQGACALAMLLTFMTYQFMLREVGFSMYLYPSKWDFIKDIISHWILPIWVMLNWLLFLPKGLFRWYDCFAWMLFPLCYLIVILLRGLLTGMYPYFFLNLDTLGILKVFIFVCIYFTIIWMFSMILFGVDYLLGFLAAILRTRRAPDYEQESHTPTHEK